VIFGSDDDIMIAKEYIDKLDADNTFSFPIVTELRGLEKFYIAEDYHQNYYDDNSDKPYCAYVIDPKIMKLREKFTKYLKR
jgi:peptide-methionine (S)-S-oxide reductase